MPLSDLLTLFTEVFAKLPQKKIAQAISLLLLGYIAYLCAQITWLLVPQQFSAKSIKYQSNIKNKTPVSNTQIDLSSLQALNLFGFYKTKADEKSTTVVIKNAPETRLNLTLTGVVASNNINIGAAIIENAGTQTTYGLGENITGTRATLERVMTDRVLIKQAGRLETLMLDGINYQKVSVTAEAAGTNSLKRSSAKQKIDQRKNAFLNKKMRQLKKDLSKDPSKITDYLKISPKRNAGKIVGYRLMPGKERKFFQAAGLKFGDVAIQMNGLDLSKPAQAAQALKALREDTEISLTVDRQGEITEILFSINK